MRKLLYLVFKATGVFCFLITVSGIIIYSDSKDIFDIILAAIFGGLGWLFFTKSKKFKNVNKEVASDKNTNQQYDKPIIETKVKSQSSQNLVVSYIKKPITRDFVVFDFETTGLSPVNDKIIEIGLVKYREGIEIDSLTTLINPKIKIPAAASNVNNITNSMVKNMPCIEDVHDQVTSFINGETLVAHNAPFDIGFLVNNFNIDAEQLNVFDTLAYCRKYFTFPNNKLGTVAKHMKIAVEPNHRSKSDCLTTAEVYLKIVDHFEKYETLSAANEYEKQGKIVKAMQLYEETISNNCIDAKPYEKLAAYYKKANDTDNEIRVLNKAIYVFGNIVPFEKANRDSKLVKFKEQLSKLTN